MHGLGMQTEPPPWKEEHPPEPVSVHPPEVALQQAPMQ